jgi:1-phosphatidylinositol-4-phosphate 5-kinase
MIESENLVRNLGSILSEPASTTIHSNPKLLSTASKSSSEGLSTLDGIHTAITSMEDNSNITNLDGNTQELQTTQYQKGQTCVTISQNNILIEDKSGNSNVKIISSEELNHLNIVHNQLSEDKNNFKVSIPFDDSLVHMQEDISTETTSSENLPTLNDADIIFKKRSNSTHSYRILSGTTKDIETHSVLDPLTPAPPIKDSELVINIPQSEPTLEGNSFNLDRVSAERKNNTYPRISNGDADKSLIALSSRHKSFTNGTRTSADRRTFQSISTIKIPDNYQRTELAITSGTDYTQHHHHHFKNLSITHKSADAEYLKGHRTYKTSTFINNSRIKSKMKADDLYNIPGQEIFENHENYAIVYDLVTGIRFSVSRCSKVPNKISDDNFKQVVKLIFNREGNTQAPPTKYEFKFKDYAPDVFRELRSTFNVNQADYLMSLNDEIGVKAVGSSGKSGSSFYYSNDRKFIIKTIHRSEHKHLRRILKDYYNYVKKNPNTLLCQFYGLHRLKMTTRTGTVKVHVLVMNNLLPTTVNINDSYDLKGSTYGRKTSEKKKLLGSCMKDLDFIENKTQIFLSKNKKQELEAQLKKDVNLLKRLNIMDYSLLLGIRCLNRREEDEIIEETRRFSPIVHQDVPGAHKNTIFDTDGGIRAVGTEGEVMDIVYYFGIIDCLTNYSTFKKLETFFRSLRHKRETISAIPPHEYGERFLKFILDHIETPGENLSGKKKDIVRFKAFKKLANHHTA